jgi:hypothetical protein
MESGGISPSISDMRAIRSTSAAHIGCRIALGFALIGTLHASSAFAVDNPAGAIEGLWSGADTNDASGSAFLCIKLTSNGQGAFVSGTLIAIPGTFRYTQSEGQIDYVSNDTVSLNGTLRYDAASDSLIYQAKPPRASRAANPQGPVIMSRDADELKDTILRLVLDAKNEEEVTARLRPLLETVRHATNYDDAVVKLRPVLSATTNRVRSGSEATTSPTIQLLEFGTFRKLASTNDVSEPGSLTGARHAVSKVALVESTTNVPARISTSFGFRVKFAGKTPDEVVRCTAKCLHPRLTDPLSGRSSEVDQWDTSGFSGQDGYIGYTFDNDWELVPGRWKLQVFQDSRLVLEKTFNVEPTPKQ